MMVRLVNQYLRSQVILFENNPKMRHVKPLKELKRDF